MKVPPSQVLVLRTPDSTVFLGPLGAWGMSELGSVAVLDKPFEDLNDRLALGTLETLKGDSWQVARLRTYLAGPAITGYGSVTVRTTRHDMAHVFRNLRTHLRAHRLRAVVIRNHERVVAPSAAQRDAAGAPRSPGAASAGPQVARPSQPGLPSTLLQGGSLPASRPQANVAGWSTLDRLMALLHDTLPLLGPSLRAHVEAMTSTEAIAHMLAGMALMAGLQAVPVVGEAADAAFLGMAYAYAGWDGLRAIVHLVEAVQAAVRARSEAEIAAAAPGAADALVTLGGAFLDAVALKMAKRSTSGGGKDVVAEGSSQPPQVNAQRGAGIGRKTSPANTSTVYHVTSSPGAAQGVLGGINPDFLNPNSRFGRAFYVAEQPDTTLAELAHHNVDPSTAIRFSTNNDAMNVLDLTDPETAAAWNYTGGPITPATQEMGTQASTQGYNAIRFYSERAPGTANYAILDDYNEILIPVAVSPAKP